MTLKLVTIGNSTGIIIPKELLEEFDFKSGEVVDIVKDPINKTLTLSKEGTGKQLTVSPRLLTILDKVNKEYGTALKKLASL